MSVHHVGRGASERHFNIGGRSRSRMRNIHHSKRSQQDSDSNRTESRKDAKSSPAIREDRYDRSESVGTRADRSVASNETNRQERTFRSHHAGRRNGSDHGVTIHVDIHISDSGEMGAPVSASEKAESPKESPDQVQLNRRQSRRLAITERRIDRMVERGHGERAMSRIERQIERAEARIESGSMDADRGGLYVDSLREMLTNVKDRITPSNTESDPVVDADEVVTDQPETPFNELPENLQTWVRKFHSKVMGFEKLGNTDHAIAVLTERIDWARGKAEAGTMNETNANNLATTLEHIVSRLEASSSDAATTHSSVRDGSDSSETIATDGMNDMKDVANEWDWMPWKPEMTEPTETPFRDLPLNLKTWVSNYRSKAMDAFKAGNDEKAQGMIADRIAWVDERTEIGLMEPQTAANLKASLENILERMSEKAGAKGSGDTAVPGTNPETRNFVEVNIHHRNEMYSYAARQYGLGS